MTDTPRRLTRRRHERGHWPRTMHRDDMANLPAGDYDVIAEDPTRVTVIPAHLNPERRK